jgi:signal transduction histidine kinase
MTLKTRIRNVTLVSVVAVGLITALILFGYWKIHASHEKEALAQSVPEQIEKLIPSLLLPEQIEGVELLLERFKTDEQLSDIRILPNPRDLPKLDSDHVSIVWPIEESGQILGYLYKTKQTLGLLHTNFVKELMITFVILLFVLFAIFWAMRRVTSEDIPRELDALLKWTESLLSSETEIDHPKLKFEEFKQLSFRIKTLIEQYELSREQAAIGQLTSGIMHDIKTPLHSLLTAYHLADEIPQNDPKRVERLEGLAKVSGTKLKKICDIVELTLDGYRDLKINPVNSDLKVTLLKSLTESKELLDQRGILVELNLTSSQVKHDRVQLSRVFSNLIRNAAESFDDLKFSPQTPRVRVSISGHKVMIEDSGPGLRNSSDKIFSIFRSTKPRGSGLGLLVSKKIIEAHRGLIRAYPSQELKGACFEVEFPEDAYS